MENELTKLSNKELIEIHKKYKEFINFLEKEEMNIRKMSDEK